MKTITLLLSALLLFACSSPDSDASAAPTASASAGAATSIPGDQCYLLTPHLYAPSSGSCYVVTADEWSTLVTCEGTEDSERVLKTWANKAQEISSFQIPAGGCFQYYACADTVAAPTVTPCQ